MQFTYLNIDEIISQVEIYQQIYGLYSWLQMQLPALPNCGKVCTLAVTIRMYHDPTLIN